MCSASDDPRQRGLFAAAFVVGYMARAAQLGISAIIPAAPTGPFGLFDNKSFFHPVAAVIKELAACRDERLIPVEVPAGARVAAVAVKSKVRRKLWLANLSADPVVISIEGYKFFEGRVLDVASLASSDANSTRPILTVDGNVTLDAYAVCYFVS